MTTHQQSNEYESRFMHHLRQEMAAGVSMAKDPDNADLPALAIRTTTRYSPWFMSSCSVCHNKFREGDYVRLCPQCDKAYHDDSQFELHCWQDRFADEQQCTQGGKDRFSEQKIEPCTFRWSGSLPDTQDELIEETAAAPPADLSARFVGGLRTVWQPFGDQLAVKVRSGDPIVGRNCPWCRFRVRVGDWVVACPCDCGTFFHQDVSRHLTCWNEWNGVEGNDFCPNTGRSYNKESNEPE